MTIADERPEGSNASENQRMCDVIAMSRRSVLQTGVGAGAVAFMAGTATMLDTAPVAAQGVSTAIPLPLADLLAKQGLGFSAVPVSDADTFVVPAGYTAEVLIPWGTPILSTGPAWKKDAVGSTGQRNGSLQHIDWRLIAKDFPRPGVELESDGVEVVLTVAR